MIHQAIGFCDCPVFVVSHTRKAGAETIEDVAGSHQRAAGADVILLVTAEKDAGRIERSTVVFAKLRDAVDEHPEPATFAIDKAGEAWALSEGDAGDKPAHERVAKFLAEEGEATGRKIRDALKISGRALAEATKVLLAERRVEVVERRVRGQTRDVLRLLPSRDGIVEKAR
jgi:hypothetical protein